MRGLAHKSPSMQLSKESATDSCVIAFKITLLLWLPFIFESMCQGALRAKVALLVEGTEDENYFSIVSHCAHTAACLHALQYCCDEDGRLLASYWFSQGHSHTVAPGHL